MKFYLGTHVLNHIEKSNVPLFISFRSLRKRKKKRFDNKIKVCVDSGGFTELNINGQWTITPEEYNKELIRLKKLGLNIEWAAQQDYMCEPFVIEKTGLDINTHQKLTVENFLKLRSLNSEIHYIPVLQGYELKDYFEHFEMFEANGIDLRTEPVVGVGSVCRRQNTKEIEHLFKCLNSKGLNLHGFGVKTNGLKKYSKYLKSADSLAWSFSARIQNEKCDKCKNKAIKNCANCFNYAINWRCKMLKKVGLS